MSQGRCRQCQRLPPCPFRHFDTVLPVRVPEIWTCFAIYKLQMYSDYVWWKVDAYSTFLQGRWEDCLAVRPRRRGSYSNLFSLTYQYNPMVEKGCRRVCYFPSWLQKCCRSHYGRDCQGKEGERVGQYEETNVADVRRSVWEQQQPHTHTLGYYSGILCTFLHLPLLFSLKRS